jgi:hypothetical protein
MITGCRKGIVAFEDRFHRSVAPVCHPSGDLVQQGGLLAAVPEENALHPAGEDNAFPDHIGILTRSARRAYRPAASLWPTSLGTGGSARRPIRDRRSRRRVSTSSWREDRSPRPGASDKGWRG